MAPKLMSGDFMRDIAARVRRARVTARLTQAELALATGVKRSAVAQWERVNGTNPSPEHLASIALATGFLFEWLATGRGLPSSDESIEPPQILDIAQSSLESRMLDAMKRLPDAKQELAVRMVGVLAGD